VETFQPTQRLTRNGDDISVANLNRRRPRIRARLPLVANAGGMARQRACIGPPRIEQGKCCWMHNASDGENPHLRPIGLRTEGRGRNADSATKAPSRHEDEKRHVQGRDV
jgi:hypothetical protein